VSATALALLAMIVVPSAPDELSVRIPHPEVSSEELPAMNAPRNRRRRLKLPLAPWSLNSKIPPVSIRGLPQKQIRRFKFDSYDAKV
jgi:hypothetical protein